MADPTASGPLTGAPHPALASLVGQMETPEGQAWAINTAQNLQQHITGQALASKAQAGADEFQNNLTSYRQGMVSTVQSDPTALEATLNTIAPTIRAVVAGHPNEEERGPAGDALIQHLQGEVVGSAVQAWANQHEGIARQTLDKYKDLLDPETHGHLSRYIDNMAMMRQADFEGQQRDQLQALTDNSDRQAIAHLGELGHADTGQVQFPRDWGQRMMANPAIVPETKASLLHAYARLQVQGDPPASNPDALSSLIRQAASTAPGPNAGDIIGHVGDRLTVQDAGWLATRTGPQPPQVKAEMQAVADTLQDARSQIGNRVAYGRFVNWFMPAYQRATAQGLPYQDVLSPESKGYVLSPERMKQFQPTGNDAVAPIPKPAQRPSLKELFGGR